MELYLNDAEYELLRRMVEREVRELRHEIARTDSRDFRALLREKQELLETIMRRLSEHTAPAA